MYYIYNVKDTFKMPPDQFGEDIAKVAASVLQKKYEGMIDKDMGVIVCVFDIGSVSDGIVYPGDPATHHDADFKVLAYMPQVEEVVAGDVTELADFGAFVRIGPVDGLVHVSQIANDFISLDKKVSSFISRKTGISLKKGDLVYAKISTVSMKNSIKDSKIALTMSPEGLGKPEWANVKITAGRERGMGGSGQKKAAK